MPTSRFLILTRSAGTAALNLKTLLAPLGHTELIVDQAEAQGIWYPNSLLSGYQGLMGSPDFPTLTAWSRALYHVHTTLQAHELIWFVEEDVAGNATAFAQLVRATERIGPDLATLQIYSQSQQPAWAWWPLHQDGFTFPWKSFNPLCCLSAPLLQAIFQYQAFHKRLIFHELLFASVAMQARLKVLDWGKQPQLGPLFTHFRWRPLVTEWQAGISHPVKDPRLHSRFAQSGKAGEASGSD